MRHTTLMPALSVLSLALLVSSCAAEATPETETEETTSAAEETAPSESAVESEDFEDGGPQPNDLYAPPLPPGSEDPPIYDYRAAPDPAVPFDHAPLAQAFSDALESGSTPDEAGLIEFEHPLLELTVNGETFTVDGLIDPGRATPLYEDQLTQDGVGPLAEELTSIPWHSRREAVLQDNVAATACSEHTQHLWVAFDTEVAPTCFEEPGGVTDPYFRGISAFCTKEVATSARTVYKGFGGEHSFDVEWGDRTGWDMMYRGPSLEGGNTCNAFTLPVRGATTE